MAERRMMSKKVIHSDAFLDMPISTQNLYFHLLLDGDDDGFVNSPKRVQRTIGASDDDAKLLLAKKFILSFDSGVIVIKHWRMHNYIQKDRYKETTHLEEKQKLHLKDNNVYTLDTNCTPSIGKESIGENSVGKKKEFTFTLKRLTSIENTNKEYKTKLEEYIKASNKSMTYEEFYDKCVLKDYKYKDFKRAYDVWNKESKETTKPKMMIGGKAI